MDFDAVALENTGLQVGSVFFRIFPLKKNKFFILPV